MKIDFNFAPDTKVTLAANGRTESVDLWSRAHRLFEGHAGRVNVYDGAMKAPSAGTAVVRSDGRTTVNLLDQTGPTEVTVKLDGDRTGIIRTPARAQKRGMPEGLFYWLAQDANGRFLPTPGQRHRKVYVSNGPAGMTKAKIAAHAGVTEATVTGAWLMARPQYGGSESMPLAMNAFDILKWSLWPNTGVQRSDWVLLERGHSYAIGWPSNGGVTGESALHPFVLGAWGKGARPLLTVGHSFTYQFSLFRDLSFGSGVRPKFSYGVIYENCRIHGPGKEFESNLAATAMATMREVAMTDIWKTKTDGGSTTHWAQHADRASGLYAEFAKDMMFDGCLVDMAGWARGYDYNLSLAQPHPPSMYSHGMYLQYNNKGLHIRECWSSQNASQGIQIRQGGQVERSLFADNNIAGGFHAGTGLGTVNQFINFMDNVNFGSGYKRVGHSEGGYNWGFDVSGHLTGMLGNVVAHLADPENPTEVSTRKQPNRPDGDAGNPYNRTRPYTENNTQVYAWGRNAAGQHVNEMVAGLDPAVLNRTTIQRFAGAKLGTARATIDAIVDWMRDSETPVIGATVREAVQWTKTRFGRPLLDRTAPADLVFRADARVDGFRWDNRYNWSTQDYPGQNVADTVDLDGHDVLFGTVDCDIASLTTGGGRLDVTSGRLETGAVADPLDVTVRLSGDLRLGATAQPVTVKANGGRLALNGAVSDLALEARNDAEVLFGPNARVPAGKRLVLSGQRVMAGWDGTGTATLTVAGALEFRVGVTLAASGTNYTKPYIDRGMRTKTDTAQFTLGTYHHPSRSVGEFTVSDLTGTLAVGQTFLMGVQSIAENTRDIELEHFATINAITSAGVPQLRRFRSGIVGDGVTDPTVAASLVLAAGSRVVIDRADLLAPGTYALTGPGVTVTDQGATLPAGVSVKAGTLVLVV